jgi:DNA polymerase III subunit delta
MKEAQNILKQLESKIYQPVYFLQGEETYYIDLISDYIEDKILSESDKGFNQTVLYGKEVDVNTILQNARRFPMMSDKQVVIVKEAQDIKDINKESGETALINYLEQPLASTILVFAHKNKTIDGRKSLGKTLVKKAVFLNTKRLYEDKIPDWISSYVKEKGYRINAAATNLIANAVGTSLSNLANELSKIFINLKAGEEINQTHVEKNIGVSKDFNIFELVNAVLGKNILKANQIINYFDKNPKSGPLVVVVSNLFSSFSKLLVLHSTADKSDRNLAVALGVNPFFVKDYKTAGAKYNLTTCVNIIAYIREADAKSKGIGTGDMSDLDISKELIFKILHA